MKYLSLFSGIGGFELGLGDKHECVGFSEVDKYAIQIYNKHYPNHKNYGDITKLDPTTIPDFDILVGGFPCQAFSIAGKRRGFLETRGTLFFDIARILKVKQPRLLILENVKGLLSHDNGNTFKTIISTLDELGYDLQWQVLNSKNFGVPQNRERVFIVGHLRGTSRPEVFPITDRTEPIESSTCLDANYWKGADKHGQRTLIELTQNESDASRVYDAEGIAKTLKGLGGGLGAKTGLYSVASRGRYKEDGTTEQQIEPRFDGMTNTLTGVQKDNMVSNGLIVRRLTPVECERLQGFPDNWTSGISDTQRYKCCGNAVTVNVIKYLVEKLSPTL